MRTLEVRPDTPESQLTADERAALDQAAIDWTKGFGRHALLHGRSLRELSAWRGVSLWWFAELHLHHSTLAPARVRKIESFLRLIERERPDEVVAVGLGAEDALLLARSCVVRGVLFHGPAPRPQRAQGAFAVSLRSRWNGAKTALGALKSLLAPAPPPPADARRARVLFLSHAAFWRERRDPESDASSSYEHYFDSLIPGVAATADLAPLVVAVGPRAPFRRRGPSERLRDWLRLHSEAGPYRAISRYTTPRVLRESWRATGEARRLWQRLRDSPALHEAFAWRGVSFADLSSQDLAATLLLQLPWAVRCCEEMLEVLDALRPALLCLYAESSGWGRAALSACRARGVPTLAVQHGILYPTYYSYLHPPDEADCPRPDLTAVFGETARRFLIEKGGYPPESLVVTGSPKFDALLALARSWDRGALRQGLGVGPEEKLLLVASRHRGIRVTHQSIGSAFPGLVRAAEALPGVRLLVKPHPAESKAPYEADIAAAGAQRARVLEPTAELLELLHAADALVTVESLSAVEALVLGRSVLVLNMPTNLREIVEQGMALGVSAGADPKPAVEELLYDAASAARRDAARSRYVDELAHGADGGALARILGLIEQTARSRGRGTLY